jgi:hypothetical protein
MVSNNPKLFELVGEIIECDPIECFGGRVYRTISRGDRHDT